MSDDGAARFLTAEWRHLVMLNYEVDPDALQLLIPPGTEMDDWNGRVLVSLVGFLFVNIRIRGFSIPFHEDFEEVNLRFYVRRRAREGWRRGVAFVREFVPRQLVATIARKAFHENYRAVRMRHRIRRPHGREAGRAEYEWEYGGDWHHLGATFADEPIEPDPDSEEAFITEHYWGYAKRPDGTGLEYMVDHPPWRVWPAESCRFEGDVARMYGPLFADYLTGPPSSALVAEGSAVTVYRGTRI